MNRINLDHYDAIAFDLEGTLADTIPVHHAARLKAFEHHGYGHITDEQHELGQTYGSSSADIAGGILHAAGLIEKQGEFKDHPVVQEVIATKLRYFMELAADGFEAMPDAVAFVEAISRRYLDKTALVTAAHEEFVLPFVERYELSGIFPLDRIISEDTVAARGMKGKPAPDPYHLAISKLSAKNLLVFEDTVPGVMAAKKAGATVVALGFNAENVKLFESDTLEYPPDVLARDYAQVRELLGL